MVDISEQRKSLFGSSKMRTVVVVLFVVLLIAFVVGYFTLRSTVDKDESGSSSIIKTPGIRSIPGVGTPSREVVSLERQQNLQLAQQALKEKTAAIPTLTDTTYLGGSKEVLGGEAVAGCSVSELGNARAAGVAAVELKCRGCNANYLKAAGFTVGELKKAGFTAAQLKAAGFSAQALKDAGFSVPALKDAGYTALELKSAGISAGELKNAGYSDDDLIAAGFTKEDIQAIQKDCSVNALAAAKVKGVAIKNLQVCGIAALKQAGYTAAELKSAGLSPAELLNAGFSSQDLKDAGFTAKQLRDAGLTPQEIKALGFTAQELSAAGFTDGALVRAGFSKAASPSDKCSTENLTKAKANNEPVSNYLSCNPKALLSAGFSALALKAAGFSAGDLRNAGFNAQDLKNAGFTPKELRDAGYAAPELKAAGYSPQELKDAGFSDEDLQAAGLSKGEYASDRCSVTHLQQAHLNNEPASNYLNCNVKTLRDAGYTVSELKNANFPLQDLKAAGYSAKELKDAGYPVQDLKAAGYFAKELIDAGFSPKDLKAAGYSAKELKYAGFSAQDLIAAGFIPKELKEAGFTPRELLDAGVSATDLTLLGVGEVSPEASATMPTIPGSPDGGPAGIEARLAKIKADEAASMSAQDLQDKIKEEQQSMQAQASDLFSSWTPLPKQQYTVGEMPQPATSEATAQQKAAEAAAAIAETLKAGTILFATLDTGVNSDENSPVMATVIQGKYKGSKLLGGFQRVGKKMTLQFNVLSIPKLENSITLSAYAIDPATARTALASSVDSHYMLRYGSLFASSFIQGLGQAIQQSGSTSINYSNGSIQTTYKDLNTTEQIVAGLGKVGEKFGAELGDVFNTPPTVKIEAGSSIGILLMQDLKIPKGKG